MHIFIRRLTIIDSDNGLSPGWRQAIIWTNARILLIGTLETHFSEMQSEINTFSCKKMHLKMLSGKWTFLPWPQYVKKVQRDTKCAFHLGSLCHHTCWIALLPGGDTRSGFIQGCAAPGSEPLPYFRESRTLKTYPIVGKSHNPGHQKRSELQKHTLF